jgi:hypothetical protein
MSTEKTEAALRHMCEETFVKGSLSAVDERIAANYVLAM